MFSVERKVWQINAANMHDYANKQLETQNKMQKGGRKWANNILSCGKWKKRLQEESEKK